MMRWLFVALLIVSVSATTHPRVVLPENTVVYALGDVHGCLEELEALLRVMAAHAHSIGCDSRASRSAGSLDCHLVTLGDYVDRGPDSKGVLDRLISLPTDPELSRLWQVHSLLGNHDDMMLEYIDDLNDHWLHFASTTLHSYGVSVRTQRKRILAAIPEAHVALLRSLNTTWRAGNLLFVHAGVAPEVPWPEQTRHSLLWIRQPFLHSAADGPVLPSPDHDVVVVHGHTIGEQPQVLPGRVGLDIGAFHSGVLAGAVFRPGHVQILQSNDDVSNTKQHAREEL